MANDCANLLIKTLYPVTVIYASFMTSPNDKIQVNKLLTSRYKCKKWWNMVVRQFRQLWNVARNIHFSVTRKTLIFSTFTKTGSYCWRNKKKLTETQEKVRTQTTLIIRPVHMHMYRIAPLTAPCPWHKKNLRYRHKTLKGDTHTTDNDVKMTITLTANCTFIQAS